MQRKRPRKVVIKNEKVLVVILKDEISLGLVNSCPDNRFVFENVSYIDQGGGDFTGFFDWLRNSKEEIIGVRLHPWEEVYFLYEELDKLDYISISKDLKRIDFYFSDDSSLNELLSCDQDFRDNRVYKSVHGEYAISFRLPNVMNLFSEQIHSQFYLL